jgi:hypothetical protein
MPQIPIPGDLEMITARLLRAVSDLFSAGPEEPRDGPGVRGIADVPFLFLKQFRDADDSRAACQQSLVEAVAAVGNPESPSLVLGRFDVRLRAYASLDIASTLGLSATPEHVLAFRMKVDFTLPLGRTLWRAR